MLYTEIYADRRYKSLLARILLLRKAFRCKHAFQWEKSQRPTITINWKLMVQVALHLSSKVSDFNHLIYMQPSNGEQPVWRCSVLEYHRSLFAHHTLCLWRSTRIQLQSTCAALFWYATPKRFSPSNHLPKYFRWQQKDPTSGLIERSSRCRYSKFYTEWINTKTARIDSGQWFAMNKEKKKKELKWENGKHRTRNLTSFSLPSAFVALIFMFPVLMKKAWHIILCSHSNE